MNLNERHADFFERVFDIVRLIPKGRITSYGAIAKALGTPSSSRMVGWAMNASHTHPGVPAHRVVNRNGLLTGKSSQTWFVDTTMTQTDHFMKWIGMVLSYCAALWICKKLKTCRQ